MLKKDKIKEKLEKERDLLMEQLGDIGKRNPKTGEWEAIPEETSSNESDPNSMADRFEDFESRSIMVRALESRLNDVLEALKSVNKASFGKCVVCGKDIESARMNVNPAAKTCKKHL